jgi:hypothetical protein
MAWWWSLHSDLTGFAPRVALVLVWIFTNLVDRAFNGFLIPLLGPAEAGRCSVPLQQDCRIS